MIGALLARLVGKTPPAAAAAPVAPEPIIVAGNPATAATVAKTPRWRPDAALFAPHAAFAGSVRWRVTGAGIVVGDEPPRRTRGEPATARRVLDWFGADIRDACVRSGVPVELVVATICTEAAGDPRLTRDQVAAAERKEPGFVSYESTPHRVSIGAMQTLLSTARGILRAPAIGPEDLRRPGTAIRAGTAYVASQFGLTRFDPVLVAAAYNAGGIYEDPAQRNPWRLRCYPLGTGEHVTRFVAWFGDAQAVLHASPEIAGDAPSFAAVLRKSNP